MKFGKNKEIWKSIPEYEELYEVSSFGRVRSLDHVTVDLRGAHKKYHGKVLHQWQNHQGYWEVTLWKDGKRKHFRVNRLVAEAFLKNPLNLPEVNHLDEHKGNNAAWNLEYISHYDNIQYSLNLHKDDPHYKKRKKRDKCQNQLTA